MRVLISRSSPSGTLGGAELSARDIVRSLRKIGHTAYLVTNLKNPKASHGIPATNIITIPGAINGWLRHIKPLNLIILSLWYTRLLKNVRPDVLFPQSRDDQIVLTRIGRRLGIPVIWRDPGDLIPQLTYPITTPLQQLNRRLQKRAIRRAGRIIMLNEDHRDELLRLMPDLPAEKLEVVGSNILFEDYSVKRSSTKDSVITIGSLSRLDNHKGIQYLIQAFLKLQHSYKKPMKLLIGGDGSYRPQLEALAAGNPDILFLGNQLDVSDMLNDLDIFVQPAEFEGWGRNVREAMLFGVPVVGSAVGGIKKQIVDRETGLLFQPKDTDSLVEALSQIIDEPELRNTLARAAQKQVRLSGDWVDTVRDEILPIIGRSLRRVRLDGSAFLSESQYSGVGSYAKQLSHHLARYTNLETLAGPFGSRSSKGLRQLLDRIYRKLASYGLAPNYDNFKSPVDVSLFPNFASWPSKKSRLIATAIHDLTYIHYPDFIEPKNLKHLRKVVPRSIERSDFIITVSQAVKQEIINHFSVPKQNILVMPIPPDQRFKGKHEFDVHTVYNIPTKDYILFLGNLEPRKNLDTLVDAYLALDETLQQTTSLIIAGGTGWQNAALERKLTTAAKSSNIRRIGYVNSEHLPSLYQKAAVFVLPSIYEGFGMGVLEAMASTTPVIAADIPALREAGGDLAHYFAPTDSRKLTSLLTETIRGPRPSSSFYQKHLDQFSWEKNVQILLKTTDTFLKNKD